jgi:hypothetical protein
VRWTGSLPNLGLAVTILDNYWAIVVTSMRAIAYVRGTAELRAALRVPYSAQFIDLQGWLGYGGVGAWILACSILALRGKVWSRGLAYVGIAAAIVYFLALASSTLPTYRLLTALVSAAAIVLGPVSYIWMGFALRRGGASVVSRSESSVSEPQLMSAPGE